ncbi:ester cyclase [Streptomyces sp. NPDC096080]|uniref:ester cyclase n=1 Tax=Streptomyces sp. NPDC096080 TaxID=3156693 RepID=UPI00332DC4E4
MSEQAGFTSDPGKPVSVHLETGEDAATGDARVEDATDGGAHSPAPVPRPRPFDGEGEEMPNTADARRERIETAWVRAWGKGDVDALDGLLSPAYLRHGTDPHPQGPDVLKAAIVSTRAAFPDLTTVIDDIVIEGDRAAIRWHSSGTHENAFLGVPPTKRRVDIGGATFARFDGDLIAEEHVTWDPRALLVALGIISLGQD